MLRNENIALEKKWRENLYFGRRKLGIKPFPQYGDLDKTLKGVPEDAIKV